jgi:toxin ParE1/3/4
LARYQLTEDAANDLEDAFAYGYETFGLQQAIEYQFDIERILKLLAENPMLGRRAEESTMAMRRYLHGRHIIYYEPRDGGVLIVGIVHMASIRQPKSRDDLD